MPEGQRTAFVARALLQSIEQDVLEQTLRRVLKEEMRGIQIQPSAEEKAVPGQMLDFWRGCKKKAETMQVRHCWL